VEETIKWGHLSFLYHGQIFVGMAAFKGHLSFGFWHQKMEKILAEDGFRTGDAMGLMGRIESRADLPDDRPCCATSRPPRVSTTRANAPARPETKARPADAARSHRRAQEGQGRRGHVGKVQPE